jgi:hypothetical protein
MLRLVLLLRFLHILGVVIFLGCGLAAYIVHRVEADAAEQKLGLAANVGAAIAFLSGIGAVSAEGLMPGFGKAGWIQIMITCGLVAGAMNGMAGARLGRLRAEAGEGKGAADAEEIAAARRTIGALRTVFLVAGLGAIVCGVWRFSW